ncbi:MAG: hypothetical protein FGM40_07250, partial [Rhodocyclaceae bacterium]|nr:hypothetical protein [Rhodocyclaceae bacterium]
SAAPAAVTPEPAPLTAALAGALDHPALPWLVGGAAATLVLAGAAWLWRRRRARRQAGEPEQAGAVAAATAPAVLGVVDESMAAALDEPLGEGAPLDATPQPAVAVARLDDVTAEPDADAPADELDGMFSAEAIAAAQAAIKATAAAAPASAATGEIPDLEALLAYEEPLADGAAAAEPAAAAPTRDAPAAADGSPAAASGDEDDAGSEADLEDVEVNLAKAYLDMGDPEGARAILEGMLADQENPQRAGLARRTMLRFGMQVPQPPADA